ncbi:hypothetical protein [Rhizobium aouanii]|uniref:Uncharacterized protein n=1 Tax=Rhizobium aouanii TaxID=3118145 RepID=A0ABU8CPV7_9HYPH
MNSSLKYVRNGQSTWAVSGSSWLGRDTPLSVEVLQQSAPRKIQAIGGEFSAQLGAVLQIEIQ